MEILETQAEGMCILMQQLEQQVRKQQEALQVLAEASVDTYTEFLRTPLIYYQQTLGAAETLTRQGLEQFQNGRRMSI